jgi:hypothetical protein
MTANTAPVSLAYRPFSCTPCPIRANAGHAGCVTTCDNNGNNNNNGDGGNNEGKVVELIKQNDTEAVVKIKWNKSCFGPGDTSVTKHVLKKSKWNPQAKDVWKINSA